MQIVGAPFFLDHQVILDSKADPALRRFLAKSSRENSAEVNVLLVFSEIPSAQELRALHELGMVESFTGHVATMHLRIDQLPEVASLNFVDRVSYPKTLIPKLDASIPEILADKVWETVRDTSGNSVNGTGVVIGIVDTGIDLTHGDFFFDNGTSKVPYLWDQSTNGQVPQGFDYGNECVRSQIEIRACSQIDGDLYGKEYLGTSTGHGTAVAAVAASTGEGTDRFENCLRFDGTRWYDDAVLCRGVDASPMPFLASSLDYRYFERSTKFNQISASLTAAGKYGQIIWEYSQGGGRWGELKFNPNSFYNPAINFNFTIDNDGTASFSQNGTVFFSPPLDWKVDNVNQASGYWIRVKAREVTTPAIVSRLVASPPYVGVAPGALIIPVKLREGNENNILDGMEYIVSKARELGLPVVINDSFGDSLGPHDGTGSLELALTDLASDGVPIVVAAGNFRDAKIHVSGRLSRGQSVTVPWLNINSQEEGIDLWYSKSDVLAISVKTPGGVDISGPTQESGVNTSDGNVVILSDESPTGKEWSIDITPKAGSISGMNLWSFNLVAQHIEDGSWDAWTKPGEFVPNINPATVGLYKIDPSDTIDYPGTARGVITVGAYITKYYWRSGCSACIQDTTSQGIRGVRRYVISGGVGDLTAGSGMGPTRDGRTKPDITAPGSAIAVARPFNREGDSKSDPDNHHRIVHGTSFSAPHVAGVIALMLQMNRYLSPGEIKTILTQDGRQDRFTGSIDKLTGSPSWGWGKVNALNSTLDALSLYAVRVEIDSLGLPLTTNLTLDGKNIVEVLLNQTRPIVLEFRHGGNHTVAPSPIIQVDTGTRFALVEEPWTFSTGGVRRFHYQLQYYLHVKSAVSYPTGTGWYNAGSIALASVVPSVSEGYEFAGWIGAISSDSPTVQVRMDSGKEIVAVWRPVNTGLNMANIMGVALAIAISLAIALVVRYKLPKRSKPQES